VSLPKIVSHDEWVAARRELLVKEKEATKARDRLTPNVGNCRWSR
jgi:predicted dithiol-disulfide oxidoreductase (DUF899 family)